MDDTQEIELLVLTTSAKNTGLCVSGIDMENNTLVRLVADESGSSIPQDDWVSPNGRIECLETAIISARKCPLKIQRENFILEEIIAHQKKKNDAKYILRLLPFLENGNLLETTENRLSPEETLDLDGSLMLAEANEIRIYKISSEGEEIKIKTKIDFSYNNQQYKRYSVTDFDYFSFIGENLNYSKAILVISTSEYPYKGYHYKFVAKIIPLP